MRDARTRARKTNARARRTRQGEAAWQAVAPSWRTRHFYGFNIFENTPKEANTRFLLKKYHE
jgi:hypothetical protein